MFKLKVRRSLKEFSHRYNLNIEFVQSDSAASKLASFLWM